MECEWEAIYTDGTSLKHIENNVEHLFSEIDKNKLHEFKLLFDNGLTLSLFLDNGIFFINGFLYKTNLSNRNLKYDLIFFKRVAQRIDVKTSTDITYNIGFKVNIGGKVEKRLIRINKSWITFLE